METAEKISSVHGQHVITDCEFWNCFSKFSSGDMFLRNEPRLLCPSDLNQDDLRKLVECILSLSTQEVAFDLNIYWTTICCHLKKIGKVSKKFS